MKDKKPLSFFVVTLLTLFFTAPIIVILYYFPLNFDLDLSELAFAFKNSLFQSVTTAFVCIALSLALVPGLSDLKKSWIKKIMGVALLPSILPSIFTVLIIFSLFKKFPFGHSGVILIFFVTYFGMSTLILYNAYTVLVSKYAHVIKIYNISTVDRYFKIYLPELSKPILTVFLIIVLGCFSSLSVPLLAGGGRSANIEILIYESIFLSGQWGLAAVMALIQMGIMFVLGLYLNQVSLAGAGLTTTEHQQGKKVNFSLIIFLSYVGLYVLGYLYQLIKAVLKVGWSEVYFSEFTTALVNSFLLCIISGTVFLVILFSLFFIFYQKTKSQFLTYFLLPSTTVVGLSLYLFFPERTLVIVDALKIALGLNLIYTLALYKSYIQPALINIQSQLDVARIYNISFADSLKSVIWPQLSQHVLIGLGVLSLFSFCEFALIKAAGSQTLFSGIFVERLISSYRLEQGFIFSFIILCLVFSFFYIARLFSVKD